MERGGVDKMRRGNKMERGGVMKTIGAKFKNIHRG